MATPSSNAAAMRKVLNVEPGSNASVIALLRQIPGSLYSKKLSGLKDGALAMARISPVFGFITIAIPLFALLPETALTSSFSAIYWIVLSMVRTRFMPL